MARILVPLPHADFDPTEAAVPWRILVDIGHEVRFATPDGRIPCADPRMVEGSGLGWLAPLLRANSGAVADYRRLQNSPEFRDPLRWDDVDDRSFDALLLPGGHAPGMREYLESIELQAITGRFFATNRPVGAICHGTVLAARSPGAAGRSVLFGRRTTGLTRSMEMLAWRLTRRRLGNYYRTYPQTVQDEVMAALRAPTDFVEGPPALLRDSDAHPGRGFVVADGAYLSARWPGDAHRFGHAFAGLLAAR
jgi:protease I